jgi:hypothetical protein
MARLRQSDFGSICGIFFGVFIAISDNGEGSWDVCAYKQYAAQRIEARAGQRIIN